MKRPKHDRLPELLMDAFWAGPMLSLTSSERMVLVVERLIRLLNEQPRSEDDPHRVILLSDWRCLALAADWLAQRLEDDIADV